MGAEVQLQDLVRHRMAKWRKPSQSLIDLFMSAIPQQPEIEHRKMFGFPAAFVNGNMFAGLHQEDFMVRLSEDDRAEAGRLWGVGPFEPEPGKAMREYISLPETVRADASLLTEWIARSLEYVGAMPPKRKKKRA